MEQQKRIIDTAQKSYTYKCAMEKGSGEAIQLKEHGWHILNEEVSFPIAVIKQSQLDNNIDWMQTFSEQTNVLLAPHGKTTMAPELFSMQQKNGCWGISLATVHQVVNAASHGINKIILANQLVGKYHMSLIADLLSSNATRQVPLEMHCFVDSIQNINALGEYFSSRGIKLNVLLEFGVDGGRCGWRDLDNVGIIVKAIKQHQSLNFCGVSFYEGVIHGENAHKHIESFVAKVCEISVSLQTQNQFTTDKPIITGAGSAWYDIVAKEFNLGLKDKSHGFMPIIRPGCYVIHDTGIYENAQNKVIQRSQVACDVSGELVSSLTLWAYVISVPEPNLAIVGLGKRDVAFDAGLPTPQSIYKPGTTAPKPLNNKSEVIDIMDQHCMMKVSETTKVSPGDIVSFSSSHPCLTIDKWRQIGIVDDHFVVNRTIKTFF